MLTGQGDQGLMPVYKGSRRTDCPEISVTQAEAEVFARWFGDLFDKRFGPGG